MTKQEYISQANNLLTLLENSMSSINKAAETRAILAVASQLLKDYASDNVFTEVLLHHSKTATVHQLADDEYDKLIRDSLLYYF